MHVSTEADRKTASVNYVKTMIDDIEMALNDLNYTEDVNGELRYERNACMDEKSALKAEKAKWEKMLDILTMETPFLTW